MQMLLAISILCFIALVWAGIALARHIRASSQPDRNTSFMPRIDFAQHLFNAIENERSLQPRKVRSQTLQDITAQKSWNQTPEGVAVRSNHELHPSHELRSELPPSAAEQLQVKCKPPQTSHRVGSERLDWASFNKDLGDLTGPYQTPSRRVNARNSSKRY
jgi:hypothetical protein